MTQRFLVSVALILLTTSSGRAQITTTTAATGTTTSASTTTPTSATASSALAAGPLAGTVPSLPTANALGVVQAVPGASNARATSAASASSVPAWLLCLADAPESEALIAGSAVSCGP